MEKPVHLGKENPQEKHLYLRRTGRYTQKRDTSGVCIYTYNTKNQQTSVQLEDGTIQTNRYDPEGLRHEMEENGKLLRFVYHKGELVYERGEKEQTSYHQGAGTEALNRAGKIYYYHKDEQLSTALITDEQGTIKNTYLYDAFGNALASAEQIENRIRYTGQQYDGITGQYYLRARYYNPAVGRFMQEDTYRGDGLNLYAYCANNPVTYYDPSGYAGTSSYVAADGGDGGAGDGRFDKDMSETSRFVDALSSGDAKVISGMSREQLQTNLPEGWTYSEHNGRIHIKDANGNFRVRVDPPDKVTNYQHMHILDESKNSLDINGNIVSHKSPDGHIPWES